MKKVIDAIKREKKDTEERIEQWESERTKLTETIREGRRQLKRLDKIQQSLTKKKADPEEPALSLR